MRFAMGQVASRGRSAHWPVKSVIGRGMGGRGTERWRQPPIAAGMSIATLNSLRARKLDHLGPAEVHLEPASFDKNPRPDDLPRFGDAAQGATAQAEKHRRLAVGVRSGPAANVVISRRAAGNKKNPHVVSRGAAPVPIAPAQVAQGGGNGLAEGRVHAVSKECIEAGAFVGFVEVRNRATMGDKTRQDMMRVLPDCLGHDERRLY